MIIALAGLAVTVLVHLAGAVWWASRVSADLRHLITSVDEARVEIRQLKTSVQEHETAIAVLETIQAKTRNGVSRA